MASVDKIKEIESLLDKYYQGETTLQQENELREFFTTQDVPQHLLFDKAQFVFQKQEKSKTRKIDLNLETEKSSVRKLNWMNYAAAAILLISVGWFSNVQYEKYQKQQEVKFAYEQTQKAMKMLAVNFNKGVKGAQTLAMINKTQNEIINKKYSK